LVVDDTEDSRASYVEGFAEAGWHVDEAFNGEHALLKLTSFMPDIVVMDLAMPVLNAWEATRNLKRDPRTKHIPVIALTGHTHKESLQRARDAGADVVLTKPCPPVILLQAARRLLQKGAP
jgi:CheY-like chemotaxis protein